MRKFYRGAFFLLRVLVPVGILNNNPDTVFGRGSVVLCLRLVNGSQEWERGRILEIMPSLVVLRSLSFFSCLTLLAVSPTDSRAGSSCKRATRGAPRSKRSPGSSIAFVSTRDGNPEIYLMRADGSSQTRLTRSPGSDLNPCQSPDGSHIVFESNRDGNWEIYIKRDGTGLRRLTYDKGEFAPSDRQPVFSADGRTIAWTSTRDVGGDIWLMDSSGAHQRALLQSSDGSAKATPAFSPQGQQIAYFVQGAQTSDTIWTLQLCNWRTGAVTTTSITSYNPRHLRYNRDGSKLAFSGDIPNVTAGQIGIYDLKSKTEVWIPSSANARTAQNRNDPDYSRDGRSIAWHSSAANTNGPTAGAQIYVSAVDGSNVHALTSTGDNYSPDW